MTTVQGQKVKGQGHKVTHKTCTFTHNVVLNCEARATAARVAARRRVVARQARCVFAQRFTFIDVCARANTNQQTGLSTPAYDTIRYDTRCYFNVRSKADISQLNLPHGTDN